VPTFDWGAFAQRVFGWITRAALISLIIKAISGMFNLVKTPMFIVGLYLALLWFPDTIQWIFMKIGEIQIKMFMIVLTTVMPEVFTFGSGDVDSWAAIWNQGLSALPTEMLEVINGLGVAEMLGLITSTIMAGSTIMVYRKIMTRAGLL
jgi:hypothetical protein